MTSKGNEAHAGDAASDAQAQNIREDATTPPDRRSAWRLLGLTACFAIAFIYLAYASFSFRDLALASRCEMAWMSPGYLRMDGLTEQHSRLARKYTLWLYREQGWDLSNKPHGVPVLFAPGNAGSYAQARSLAAEAARSFYEAPGRPKQARLSQGQQEMDFFTADFNEDFSAFHAATLREQAEFISDSIKFILSQYEDAPGRPRPSSVIVLAHSMAGVAARLAFLEPGFLAGTVKTMITFSTPHAIPPVSFDASLEQVYSDVNQHWSSSYESAQPSMEDVLLISIAGGTADTTIASDYSAISAFTPPSNGFTVFTTGIPTLYSPVDHLAMVWCDQLRKRVIEALFQGIDASLASKAKPIRERLRSMQNLLLNGLEASQALAAIKADLFSLDGAVTVATDGIAFRKAWQAGQFLLKGRSDSDYAIWTTLRSDQMTFSACKATQSGHECRKLQSPRFVQPESSDPTRQAPGLLARIAVGQGEELLVSVEDGRSGHLFIGSSTTHRRDSSLISIAALGITIDLPAGSTMATLELDGLATSLLAYRVESEYIASQAPVTGLLHAYTNSPYESQFRPMGKPASLHFHARPPFSEAAGDVAINLQVWRDPACQTRLSVRIDWYTSLGKLVLRYRAIAAAWPIILAFLCIRRQLLETGAAPPSSFNEALVSVIRLDLPRLSSLSVAIAVTQSLASAISQTHWRGLQNALLGTDRAFFWALPPLLLYITAGAVVTLHWATFGVLLVNAKVWEVAIAKLAFSGMPRFTNKRSHRINIRIATSGALVGFIVLFAPQQFAFLVLWLLQGQTALKSLVVARSTQSNTDRNRFEINYSLFFIMLLVLPQKGAILLVWLRNLQAGWYAPFPSDHNVLSVAGFLALVELAQTGWTCCIAEPKRFKVPFRKISNVVLYGSAISVLVFGPRYAFVAGIAANAVFCWVYVTQHI